MRGDGTLISCNAPYGEGGMGQFLAAIVEDARRAGELAAYYSTGAKANDATGREISLANKRWLFRSTPLRWMHAWRDHASATLFDRAVAAELPRGDTFIGFGGRALASFERARALGYRRLVLESATSHIENVRRQHARANRDLPIEQGWLNGAQLRRTLREYEMADEIIVTSEYSRASFIENGVAEWKVRRRVQPVAPRFAPPVRRAEHDGIRVVYVGRLQVTKGVPVLLDAFARVEDPNAELTLVGGPATNAMERWLGERLARDRRIRIAPGDPLPHLHRADVLAHPSYEDGLALGPLEAMACGVPVVVTEDTGMKEFVNDANGRVVPTGDAAALAEAIVEMAKRPMLARSEA